MVNEEDVINEPTCKCEMCKSAFPKEEMRRIKIDEGYDYLEICDSCYEGCIA